MSATFADAAVKLAGVAGVALGWRPDEFWCATPAELATVLLALRGDAGTPMAADDLALLKEMFPDG